MNLYGFSTTCHLSVKVSKMTILIKLIRRKREVYYLTRTETQIVYS